MLEQRAEQAALLNSEKINELLESAKSSFNAKQKEFQACMDYILK